MTHYWLGEPFLLVIPIRLASRWNGSVTSWILLSITFLLRIIAIIINLSLDRCFRYENDFSFITDVDDSAFCFFAAT